MHTVNVRLPAHCRGAELRQLIVDKWSVSYDCSLQRRGKRVYLRTWARWRLCFQRRSPHLCGSAPAPFPLHRTTQRPACACTHPADIMWRYLEQQSFPLTEEEYEAQLEAVASYVNLWE